MAGDEVLTAVPTREALDQAHLQAIRVMSDRLDSMGRSQENSAKDLRETRDAVLQIVAQDLKGQIVANRSEALNAFKDALKEIEKVEVKVENHVRAISRIQGIFLPLGALAAGILTYLGQLLANFSTAHH